jgi:hypothetical protein
LAVIALITTILPLTSRAQQSHDEDMSSPRRAVVVAETAGRRWVLANPRPWDRLIVRLGAAALDARLAAGHPVEADRRLAMRANQLVEPATRRELADSWRGVLGRAARVRTQTDPRVPLQRSRVLAVDAAIRRMIVALQAAAPIPARGVAIASALISDGTGPLYNARSELNLGAAVRDAIRHLDPSAGLVDAYERRRGS